MKIIPTALPEVLLVIPQRYGDDRGWFCESWNPGRCGAPLDSTNFVQDNQSFSANKYTVRGLHYQAPPHAQAKLVQCLHGVIFDVAVDIRVGSQTYGKSVAVELSAENGHQLFVPEGYLHGFMTLSDDTLIGYKVTDHYHADLDGAVHWESDALSIDWPADPSQVTLSDKDRNAPDFTSFTSPFEHGQE